MSEMVSAARFAPASDAVQAVAGAERDFGPRDFRDAMGQFATGVVVISTLCDGMPHAMTANAFMSGSLEPPLVIVSVACTARMHDKIRAAGMFGVSILDESQQQCSAHFSGKPNPEFEPQFEDVLGVPVLDAAAVKLVARLRHEYECGDHTLFVGEVLSLDRDQSRVRPLLFHGGRYNQLPAAE